MAKSATKIATLYLIIGVGWILLSDRLLWGDFFDKYIVFQTFKGIFYVLTTGMLLWFLVHKMENKNSHILENLKNSIRQTHVAKEKLKEERNLLRAIINNLPDYVYVKDRDSKHVVTNKALLDLFGLQFEEEALGKKMSDFFPPDMAQIYMEDDLQVMKSGKPIINKEEIILDSWGNSQWVLTTKVPLFDKNNTISGVVGISKNITPIYQKKKEDELIYTIINTLGKNKNLDDALTETLKIIGNHFHFEFAEAWLVESNKKNLTLTATWAKNPTSTFYENQKKTFPPGEGLPGICWETKKIKVWNDIQEHSEFRRKEEAVKEQLNVAIGIPIILKGEVIAIFTFLAKKLNYNHKEIKTLLKQISLQIVYHIELKKHEKELEDYNKQITDLLESINDGFYAINEDWTLSYCNTQAEILLGKPRTEIINKNIWESFPEAANSRFYDEYSKVMREKKAFTFQEYFEPLSAWFEINVYPSKQGISLFFRDVTEKKRLNAQLSQRMEELAVSNAELEQFAYITSHDLQEPLRMITGFLTLLEKKYTDVLDDKGKQYIHFAVDGATRMRKIMLDLLEYSKVGKIEFQDEKIDVAQLITDISNLNKTLLEEQNATITTSQLPVIFGGKTIIQQVFQNLIVNAIKYKKPDVNPQIVIKASEDNNFWQFSVSDNGIGINESFFDKIFVLFQRLHNKEDYSGTGIGLSICKKIVETHGGKIWVESEEKTGSTFYFTIKK